MACSESILAEYQLADGKMMILKMVFELLFRDDDFYKVSKSPGLSVRILDFLGFCR